MDWIVRKLVGARRRITDGFWEWRFGVDTSGLKPMPCDDGHWYMPIPYLAVFRILEVLGLGGRDVLFEMGCGKGRVLLAATRTPVGRLVGVELDPELAMHAERNLSQLRGRRTPYEIRNQNALDVDFDEATAIVLIDPFGAETLKAMLVRVRESVERRPRDIRIAFFMTVSPESLDVLAGSGWLARSGRTVDLSIYGVFERCEVSLWKSTLPAGAMSG